MTVKDIIIESGLVKDDHEINILWKNLVSKRIWKTKGNWYQDNILDKLDREVEGVIYTDGKWTINLQEEESEESRE